MPLSCGQKVRYRVDKRGTRLAFCGSRVIEAKSKSGKKHTQGEFRRDRRSPKRGGRR